MDRECEIFQSGKVEKFKSMEDVELGGFISLSLPFQRAVDNSVLNEVAIVTQNKTFTLHWPFPGIKAASRFKIIKHTLH